MPPMYQWLEHKTGKEVEVLRSFTVYEEIPTEEEALAAGLTADEYANAKWERLIGGKQALMRGPNWTGSKGNW